MKKVIVMLIILAVSISPLFKGLFFLYEASIFFMSIAMLTVIYTSIKLIRKEAFYFNKWILFFGISLIFAYLLSFINAVNFRENLSTIIQYSIYFIVMIVLYDYFNDKKQQFAMTIMAAIVFTGLICAVIGLEALTGAIPMLKDVQITERLGTTFQYANVAAIYFVVCILFSLTLIIASDQMILKAVLAGIGSILLLALILTVSRGGYLIGLIAFLLFIGLQPAGFKIKGLGFSFCMLLPVLIFINSFEKDAGSHDYVMAAKWMIVTFVMAFIVCLFFQILGRLIAKIEHKRIIGITSLSLIAVIAIITIIYIKSRSITILPQFATVLPQKIVSRFMEFNIKDNSFTARLSFDKDALKLIASHWMLGLGGGGWISLFQSVQEFFYTAREVHNNYLQVFVEAGVLGFVSYVLLVFISLAGLIRSIFKINDTKQKIYVSGILCSFLALALHSSFDFDLSFPSIALLFWTLIAGGAVFATEDGSNINPKISRSHIIHTKKSILIVLIILSLLLTFTNGLYSVASYNAEKGMAFSEELNYKSAMLFYEKAYRLDSINTEYIFELAKLYNFFAANNTNPEYIKGWRDLALAASKRCVSLDRYNPSYREVLARTYSDSGIALNALEQLKKLVEYQPCNSSNYELLAKGYLEAAKYYIDNKQLEKAIELLNACREIDKIRFVAETPEMIEYMDKATTMMKEIQISSKSLN